MYERKGKKEEKRIQKTNERIKFFSAEISSKI